MSSVDMMDAINGFNDALRNKRITIQRLKWTEKVHITSDTPQHDTPRLTYAKMKGAQASAIVVATPSDPNEGEGCFHVGYAVREDQRGKGFAKQLLNDAIKDLTINMSGRGAGALWFEASVDFDNPASIAVAKSVFGVEPKQSIDKSDGKPFWHFMKRVELTK